MGSTSVLDPFAGSGSALIAASKTGRSSIGIDLNPQFQRLAKARLKALRAARWQYLVGDSFDVLEGIDVVDYIVTSPPYHNILRNDGKGIRHPNGKAYRRGARDGVAAYSHHPNDLGNFERYEGFLEALQKIMGKAFRCLRDGRYCTVIISDFTVSKREVCVQGDVVRIMTAAGYAFAGTTVLLQTVKPLFPFGYPYAFKINHHHQNMIHFRKPNRAA